MNCEYCNKTFSNKYTLKKSSKKAKFCLEKQKELNHNLVSDLIKCKIL